MIVYPLLKILFEAAGICVADVDDLNRPWVNRQCTSASWVWSGALLHPRALSRGWLVTRRSLLAAADVGHHDDLLIVVSMAIRYYEFNNIAFLGWYSQYASGACHHLVEHRTKHS